MLETIIIAFILAGQTVDDVACDDGRPHQSDRWKIISPPLLASPKLGERWGGRTVGRLFLLVAALGQKDKALGLAAGRQRLQRAVVDFRGFLKRERGGTYFLLDLKLWKSKMQLVTSYPEREPTQWRSCYLLFLSLTFNLWLVPRSSKIHLCSIVLS